MPSMPCTGRSSVLRGEFWQTGASPHASVRAVPEKSSVLPPALPQPNQMAAMPPLFKTFSMAQSFWLCDPHVGGWANMETLFTVQAQELRFIAADDHTTGSFNIFNRRNGSDVAKPAWVCSVLPWGLSPRALLICNPDSPGEPLGACCLPPAVDSGAAVELPFELSIRDRDSRVWGSLVPQGGDIYDIRQGQGKRSLRLFGNQITGALVAKLGEEMVAHAARDSRLQEFEIGVRTQMDPVVIILCLMSVLIFNPEDLRPGS